MFRPFFASLLFACLTATPAWAALPIASWSLDNGAKVFFVESHAIPVLDINIDFDAGTRRDPNARSGLAALTNALLAGGVSAQAGEPAMTEAQISDAIADTAALISSDADLDRAGMSLRTLVSPSEREQALRIMARVLAHPLFPSDILTRDKARTVAMIKEAKTQPESIADEAFWKVLYGAHPYANQADVGSVQAITRDELVRFHRMHYVANRAVVTLVGAISRTQADAIAQELTRRLPQGAALPALPQVAQPPASGVAENWISHPASQAHILIGMPAIVRGDPDYFPLMVGNYSLGGGGFVSRLMNEVREKRGLAYSVYSYFNPLAQKGPFQVGLQTQKEQAPAALQVVRDTLKRFISEGPSEEELQAAKDNLIGGFALRIDNNRKILETVAVIGYYGLPLDYLDTWTFKVKEVTTASVRAAFAKNVDANAFSTVVVGAQRP